jgi:hypothetical protein
MLGRERSPADDAGATAVEERERLSLAFVGQGVYFAQCALQRPAGALEPTFFDHRAGVAAGPLLARLEALDPDVILVFRPEIIPAGLFAALRAVTIGYLTEPLPRPNGAGHVDLRQRLWWLEQVDPGNFDRIVCFDPLIVETAEHVIPVWRSLPIPVADRLFMEVHERSAPPRMLFVGRSTEHREALLAPLKRRYPIMHIGHGLYGDELERVLAAADVQLNLHNNPYPSFENRVCIALAAGHLVISETLSPANGLEAGVHYLECSDAAALLAVIEQLVADPAAHLDVQLAGRREAERFRASHVYPQLVREALDDVAQSGGRRGEA